MGNNIISTRALQMKKMRLSEVRWLVKRTNKSLMLLPSSESRFSGWVWWILLSDATLPLVLTLSPLKLSRPLKIFFSSGIKMIFSTWPMEQSIGLDSISRLDNRQMDMAVSDTLSCSWARSEAQNVWLKQAGPPQVLCSSPSPHHPRKRRPGFSRLRKGRPQL